MISPAILGAIMSGKGAVDPDVALAALGTAASCRLARYSQQYCWEDTGGTNAVEADDLILRATRLDPNGGLIASSGTQNPRWDATEDAAEFNNGFTVSRGFRATTNIITGVGNPWSMCVRTRTTSLIANRCLFGASQNTIANGGVHFYAVPANVWTLEVFDGGAAGYLSTVTTMPSAGWTTLCVTYDGTNYVIDANGGTERVTSTLGGRDPNTASDMYLGSRIRTGSNWLDDYYGYVGASLFVDYALSAAQCSDLHDYWSGIWA